MKTNELFKKKTVLSFEVFPPKKSSPINTIYDTLEGLRILHPTLSALPTGRAEVKTEMQPLK